MNSGRIALTRQITAARERMARLEEARADAEFEGNDAGLSASIRFARSEMKAVRQKACDALEAYKCGDCAEASRLYAEAYEQARTIAR